MLSIHGFTKNRSLLIAIIAGSVFLSGCSGSAEETLLDILELPEEEQQNTVQPQTPDDMEPVAMEPELEPEVTEPVVTEPVVTEPVVTEPVVTEPVVTEPETPVVVVTEPVEPLDLNASLSGRIVDAVDGLPLAGVLVSVPQPGTEDSFTSTTGADGTFQLDSVQTTDTASLTLDGYRAEQVSSVSLISNSELNIGTIQLVSDDNAGEGTITGTIVNAIDGTGVEGLTLRFRQGINATTGDVVATTTTDVNGEYSVSNLPYGNLTCEIVGVGFDTSFANVISLGNITQVDQNAAVSPNLSTGEIRIVLTWGATPNDLDSHLTGPQENSDESFHVFYADEISDLVNLDVDDVSSFGPETVTIERQINGIYRYSVLNFSDNNDTELSNSGARVQVFNAGGLIREFQVPDGLGNLWTVFDLEGGNITTINTISERVSNADFFVTSAKRSASVADTPSNKK